VYVGVPPGPVPHIKLLGFSSTQGALSGVVAASATTQNSSPASLKFRNASNHGLGDYSTDMILATSLYDGFSDTFERTALTLSASGDAYFSYDIFAPNLDNVSQNNVVGWNSSTGELTYFATPSNVLSRPTSATSVVFDVDVDAAWTNLATSTGPNPTSAGQFTTNSATPGSVTQIKINKTANSAVDQTNQLEDLAVSSSITITQAGGGTGFGNYRIVTKTDNTSYMTYDVVNWGSSGGTFDNTQISTIETDGRGAYEYILSSGYNLLDVRNNGDVADSFRLKIPTNSSDVSIVNPSVGYSPSSDSCTSPFTGIESLYIVTSY
jgi:hypothetical protein